MAKDLYGIISKGQGSFDLPFPQDGSDDAFLKRVIQPIYNVIQKVCAQMLYGVLFFAKCSLTLFIYFMFG